MSCVRSVLIDLDLFLALAAAAAEADADPVEETRDWREGPPLLSELLLEELLNSPWSCFCLEGSREFSKLSACSLKWSANPQKALRGKSHATL